jgi:hypothetical protein
MPGIIIVLKYPKLFFLFNWEGKNVSEYSDLGNCWQKIMRNDKNNAIIRKVQPKFSPGLGENDGKIILTWNLGYTFFSSIIVWFETIPSPK